MRGFITSLLKKRHSPAELTEEEASQMNFSLARVIKYKELKKATNNFNTELGNGGYGRVYLGKLQDGQKVAVKALFDRNPKRLEQFFNEVTVLSRVRHKNIVSLYGCTSPHSQELLLVYEYVPNGTVADHLHGKRASLTWAMRVRIAMETAEGLAYLHALEPPIIHRDVKTSNILLDNKFHVKIGDLGICRLLPWDSTHVSTVPQGTMGYRDPEYERSFRLTDKSDVYSFGVVLMELISGQQAVDVNRAPEDIYLDGMALDKILNKKLDEFVDPKLMYHSNNDVRRMIDSLAELARNCLQPKGGMRPPMVHVLTVLKGIQNEIEQFFNKVAALSRVRHKNLVSLYGCTSHLSQELLLVYEYVPNRTVADHLHGKQTSLTWAMRVQIAIETAEALAYLHALEPPIIHRHVKTSNILLDNEFHVKIANLGICHLLPWDSTHVATVPQGTVSFQDPEYERYFRLTDKTDVYSFGVVLMELISGQQAVDVNPAPGDIYLDGTALDKILNKKLDEFVDPKLGYHSNNDVKMMIDSLAELARNCLQPKGGMSPPMVHVLTVLKGIQNEIHQMQRQDGGQQEVILKGIQNKIQRMRLKDGRPEKGVQIEIHQMQRQDGGQEEVNVKGIKHEKQQMVTNSFDPHQELGDGCLHEVYPGTG